MGSLMKDKMEEKHVAKWTSNNVGPRQRAGVHPERKKSAELHVKCPNTSAISKRHLFERRIRRALGRIGRGQVHWG